MIESLERKPLFPEHEQEIEEIRKVSKALHGKNDDTSFIFMFRDFLEAKMKESGIEGSAEDFGAYHYLKGSSLFEGSNVPFFDTEDRFVQKTIIEFLPWALSKEEIENLKLN